MEENERMLHSKLSTIKKVPSNVLNISLKNSMLDNNFESNSKVQTSIGVTSQYRPTTSIERPLVLRTTQKTLDCNKQFNVYGSTENKQAIELISNSDFEGNKLFQNNRKTPGASNTQAASTFSFVSWRTSAGLVIDTIREKLGYFRRARSTEDDFPTAQLTNYSIKSYNTDSNSVTKDILDHSEEIVKLANEPDCSCKHVKSGRKLINLRRKSFEQDESSSLYDNDSVSKLFKDVEELESKQHAANDEVKHIDVATYSPTGSTLCSPCIGSKKYVKENLLQNQNLTAPKICSNLEVEENKTLTTSKIVHHQPCNNQETQNASSKQTINDYDPLNKLAEKTAKEIFDSVQLINIPKVKFQSASSNNSINEEITLNYNASQKEGFKFCNKNKAVNLLDSPEAQEKSVESLDPQTTRNQTIGDSEDFSVNQRSINLWSLRNSLEQSKIEIQCPKTGFEDFEEKTDGRRLSVATDCMTEVSPLSTPSSDLTHFRGKSISDSEDDGRPYVVTSSGRLSPRPANLLPPKDSRFFHQSINQSSFEPNLEKNLNQDNDMLFARNHSDPSELNSFVKRKNSFLTTATIECGKQNSFSEQNSSEPEVTPAIDKSSNNKLMSAYAERRNKIFQSKKWSTLNDDDDRIATTANCVARAGRKTSSLQLLRQASLPIKSGSDVAHDVIDENPDHSFTLSAWSDVNVGEKTNQTQTSRLLPKKSNVQIKDGCNQSEQCHRRSSTNSFLSDDVFLPDQPNSDSITQRKSNQITSYHPNVTGDPGFNSKKMPSRFCCSNETTFIPPSHKTTQRPKFRTKLGSTTSSGTSSPTSPVSSTSGHPALVRQSKSVDLESDDSIASQAIGSRSSSNLRSLAKFFRRPSKNRRRCDSAPTFCGYSMDRDYCVDPQTDRIFKEFLCQTKPANPVVSLPSGESLPPPSHMVPPPPLKQTSSAQLRRQVMRKQYSDSIAMYYGQRQRKWRFSNQKSDSINCPVGRGTFRRQERIDEEFDPEEINERLSSTSSRLDSEKPEYKTPTVNELKEWRQSSKHQNRVLRHAESLPVTTSPAKANSARTGRRVTFEPSQFKDIKVHHPEDT